MALFRRPHLSLCRTRHRPHCFLQPRLVAFISDLLLHALAMLGRLPHILFTCGVAIYDGHKYTWVTSCDPYDRRIEC